MTQPANKKLLALRSRTTSHGNRRQVRDYLLALDREIVEVSMRAYNMPHREKIALRAHSRRLHNAVRRNRLAPRAHV